MCRFITWKVPDERSIFCESFGNYYIIFNQSSGETHLLNELAAEALRILEIYPVSEAELADRLREVFEVELEELLPRMSRLLKEFDNLGLIEPCC
ncbi:HPr-rel-A system PqqD family peptide chaperone [Nitrosococcus wardiae]|uniref:HPr-rel-A system PqqD family peptide chaperone n=1 Tax=Nitrosococcus wardiae TaxID=1814290 RepID=UPI00141B0ADC|nr:HPr-rel-A system PqqD family peptide chaperone [Nitrosococcus wardiae]